MDIKICLNNCWFILGPKFLNRFLFFRYYFLIYNASVLYWNFIRPYLKHGFRCHLISSLYQIVAALNQVGEQDKEWRAELMIELLECYLDASKMQEAVNFSSIAAAFIKDNAPDKYRQIFSLMDPGKLIEIECLECEYEVQKLGRKISTYTKGAVETQLKVIRRLELVLQHAVRVGDPNVVQAVCATQWNLCLPLLQHNLLQHVKKPLISVADILEKIDSLLILLRCQVHMEIARIEENGDRIEAAMEHLKKAIYLDNNGQYQELLKMAFNRLHLCTMLYKSPERLEDQAVMMIEQAKKGKLKDSVRKKRSLLVNAGLALAPDAFQIVLDSENEAQVSSGKSRSKISYLHAKAQHHIKSVEKADGHLKRLGHRNDKERISLWADLAKVARKQEVWDVCRTACRFCLLYDDTQLKKVPKSMKGKSIHCILKLAFYIYGTVVWLYCDRKKIQCNVRDYLLRTLAEIRFINAEAIIHLLRLQGVQLNDHAVLPQDTSQHSPGYLAKLPEQDQEWITYSLWIDHLSQYAMENFLRAAEIGEELNEAWIVHNTVVYVLNYNKHLIASGRQREIVESLQTLLSAVKNTGHCGNIVVLLMLCNALARGLILSWIPKPIVKFDEKKNIDTSLPVDPNRYSDIKAAIEVCEFALSLVNGNASNEVPISVQQQVIAAWVKAKQLHQQQIGQKLGTDDENNDEGQNPISKVLVALEMYSCNGLGLMDFTVPTLGQLVRMTLKCSWSDPLMELQTLTRLMYFAYVAHDHEIVMTFTLKHLVSEINVSGQELLSTAACIQGKSIMENLSGRHYLRLSASKAFVQSARYAGEAGNCNLVMLAARHFWNTCLPFIGSPRDREQLKESTEIILKSIIKAESKTKQVRIFHN
uniref:Cilia and flagella associated protein 46 n=1 Tax=Crocodylus porosus TaxID=8502 RepID=A0A7M4EJE2_CROPO